MVPQYFATINSSVPKHFYPYFQNRKCDPKSFHSFLSSNIEKIVHFTVISDFKTFYFTKTDIIKRIINHLH